MSDLKLDVAAPESPAPAAAKPGGAHPAWRLALPVVFLLLAWILVLYRETALAMVNIWVRSETFTHGFVVPPIAAWLIWRQRGRLALLAPSPAPWCLPALVLVGLFWLLGELAAVNAVTQLALVATLVLAAVAVLGTAVGRNIGFPLLFLFFAVPVGEFLMPTLMEWTANFTVLALRATGIPVFREGLHFVIPSGSWSVVEACSGVRYLIASLMVGTLFAYLNYNTTGKRLVFVVVSALVPIVANWLRAYIIVMLGHLSGNKIAAGADHLIYGWVFFGIVIAIMFAIGMRWAEPPQPQQAVRQPLEGIAAHTATPWATTLVLALIIAAGPLYESHLQQGKLEGSVELASIPGNEDWQATALPIDWQAKFANPSAELHSAYRQGEEWVGLYIAYYRNQDHDRKLVTSTNVLVPSSDPVWQIVSSSSSSAPIGGTQREVREAELLNKQSNLGERYVVWQWYWVNGQLTTSDIKAKWLTAWSRLANRGDDSAVLVLYAPKPAASSALPAFSTGMGQAVLDTLAKTAKQ